MHAPNTDVAVYIPPNGAPNPPDLLTRGALLPHWRIGSQESDGHVGHPRSKTFFWTDLLEVLIGTDIRDTWPLAPGNFLYVPDEKGQAYLIVEVQRQREFKGQDFLQVFLQRQLMGAVAVEVKRDDNTPDLLNITVIILDHTHGLTLSQPAAGQAQIAVLNQLSIDVDASGLKLKGDGTPGASQYYGTDAGSILGYHALPSSSGTVTTVSVVSANGFAGTVANPTTTPAITLTTTISGVLKGNGTALSAAVAETDYTSPSGLAAYAQPLDATLTAFAALTIAANSLTIGTGADAFSQTTFAANTFPARASTGNLVAKTVSDLALTLLANSTTTTMQATLGLAAIAASGSASDLSAGTVPTGRFPGGAFNGNSQLVQLNSSGQYPALNGSLIVGLLYSQIGGTFPGAVNTATEVTGTSTNAFATVFDITNSAGLHGSFALKNTAGVNPLAYRVTVTDMFGTTSNTGSLNLTSGSKVSFAFDSSSAGTVVPPYQEVKLEVMDGNAGNHATFDCWRSTVG